MSMNVYFEALRDVFVPALGKTDVQREHISVWQTPTDVTYEIVQSDDPIKTYFDWVRSISKEEEEPVYADDDIFMENGPIGTELVNHGESHIEELEKLFDQYRKRGYKIEANYI